MLRISIFLITAYFFTLNSFATNSNWEEESSSYSSFQPESSTIEGKYPQFKSKNVTPNNTTVINDDSDVNDRLRHLLQPSIDYECTYLGNQTFSTSRATIITKTQIYDLLASSIPPQGRNYEGGVRVITIDGWLYFTVEGLGKFRISRKPKDLDTITLDFTKSHDGAITSSSEQYVPVTTPIEAESKIHHLIPGTYKAKIVTSDGYNLTVLNTSICPGTCMSYGEVYVSKGEDGILQFSTRNGKNIEVTRDSKDSNQSIVKIF